MLSKKYLIPFLMAVVTPIFAADLYVTADTKKTGNITIDSDDWVTNDFDTEHGLSLVEGLDSNAVNLGTLTAIGSDQVIILSHNNQDRLTITFSADTNNSYTIAPEIQVETVDETLIIDTGFESSFTFSNDLSGAGNIRIIGDGDVIFNNAVDAFTGYISVESGSFKSEDTSSTFNAFLSIADGAIATIEHDVASESMAVEGDLQVGGSSDSTISTHLFGSGQLLIDTDGTVIFDGMNSLTGGISINRGILGVDAHAAQGDIAIGTDNYLDLFAGTSSYYSSAGPIHYAGALSGTGYVRKLGDDWLFLDQAPENTLLFIVYEGGVVLNETSLSGNIGVDLGASLAFEITSDATYTGNISALAGSGGDMLKRGSGVLTSTGVIAYSSFNLESGGLYLQEGSFNTDSTGPMHNEGELHVTIDNDTIFDKALTGTGTFEKLGASRLTLTGAVDHPGDFVITAGTIRFDENSDVGNITNNAAVEFNIASNETLENHSAITGTGSLEKLSDGHLILDSATQTYSGGTTVTTGTLETYVPVSSGDYDVASGATLIYNMSSGDQTVSGDVSGDGDWIKLGPDTLILDSNNTFEGTLTIREFEVRQAQADTLNGTMQVVIEEPGYFALNDFDAEMGSLAGAGDVQLGSATLTIGANDSDTSFSGVISGTGGTVKSGSGNMTISSEQTYTGGTHIQGGTITQATDNVLYDTSVLTINSGTIFDVNDLTARANSVQGSGTLDIGSGTFNYTGQDDADYTFAGNITGSGTLNKYGDGVWTLTAESHVNGFETDPAQSFIGPTNIHEGTLRYGRIEPILSTNTIFIESGATFDLNDYSSTIKNITGTGSVTLGTATLEIDTAGTSFTFGGIISEGSTDNTYSLIKAGTGVATLTGQSTYDGHTQVLRGSIKLGIDDALPTATHLTLATNGLFNNDSYAQTVEQFAGSGTLNVNTGTFTLSGTETDTFDGSLLGGASASLIIDGTSHLIISASANPTAYAGQIHVNENATFEIRDSMITAHADHNGAGHILNAGTVILYSDKTEAGSQSDPHDTIISGAGTVEITGAGTSGHITMTAEQIYTGPTHIQKGTLHYGVDQALPSATSVAIDSGATLDMNEYDGSFVALTGDGTLKLDSGAVLTLTHTDEQTFSGLIDGDDTTTIYKTGSGNLILDTDATSRNIGNFEVDAGTLTLQGLMHHSLHLDGSSTYVLDTAGTHELSSLSLSPDYSNEHVELSDGTTMTWKGNLVIESDATIGRRNNVSESPTINIQDGTLTLDNGTASYTFNQHTYGSPSLHLKSGYGLTINVVESDSTLTSDLVFDQSGILTKTGDGNAILTSNQLYTGVTTISEGTLTLNEGVELDTSAIVNNAAWVVKGTTDSSRTFNFPITGTGTLTIDAPVETTTLNFPNSWDYRGATVLTDGAVENTGTITLDGNAYTVDPQASWRLNGTTLHLIGDSTLESGIVTAGNSTIIDTTGAPVNALDDMSTPYTSQVAPYISWAAVDTSTDTKIVIEDGTSLYLDASERSMEIAIDLTGTGSLVKTGDYRAVLSPKNETNYTGSTTVSEGVLVLDEKFNISATSAATVASGATLAFRNLRATQENRDYPNPNIDPELPPTELSYTIAQYKGSEAMPAGAEEYALGAITVEDYFREYSFGISGNGGVRIEKPTVAGNAVYLSGPLTYMGPTYVVEDAFLFVDDNFEAEGDIYVDGTLHIYTPDLGPGGFHRIDNDFFGAETGRVEKYGPGNLILAGDYQFYDGVISIQGGEVFFSALPANEIENIGLVNLLALGGSILTLTAGPTEYVFSGTISGESNTRYFLTGEMQHEILTISSLELDGRIDLRQVYNGTDDPQVNIDSSILAKPQFQLDSLIVEPKSRFFFQFDQGYTGWAGVSYNDPSLRPIARLNFINDSIAQYILQGVNDTELFEDHRHRLLVFDYNGSDNGGAFEPDSDAEANEAKIDEIIGLIRAPAIYVVQAQKVYDYDIATPDSGNSIYLDVIITKRDTSEILAEIDSEVSVATIGIAKQLQSRAVSNNPGERNANRVLENAEDPEDLIVKVKFLTPTGNKKEKEQAEPTATASSGSMAQQTVLNFRQDMFTKKFIDKSSMSHSARSFAQESFTHRYDARKEFNKRLAAHYEQQNFSWAEIFDGLDIFGLSTSLEASYTHVVTQDTVNEPGTVISTWGSTLGVSQVLQDKYIVGLLGSYSDRRVELKPNNDNKTSLVQEKIRSLGFFMAYQDMDVPYYWSTFLSLGNHDYDSERTWLHPVYSEDQSVVDQISAFAWSTHDGYDISGNVEVGYTFILDQEVALQPFVGAGFAHLHEPRYQEESIDVDRNTVVDYGNIMYPNLTKMHSRSIGVQGIQSFVIDNTAFQISSRLSYVTQKNNGSESLFKFSYLYAPETMNEIVTVNERYHAFEMMFGLNIAHDYQWIISANYTGSFGNRVTSHSIVGTVQYTFW